MSEPGFPDEPKPKWVDLWGIDPDFSDTTEAAEQKRLIETATRLGYELGRKETLTEAAEMLDAAADANLKRAQDWKPTSSTTFKTQDGAIGLATGYQRAAERVRDMASQPSGAVSEPLVASTGHSDPPEDAKPPQEPCEDPTCPVALMHSHPLPDKAPVVDLVGRLRDAVDAARERRLNPPDLTKGGQ